MLNRRGFLAGLAGLVGGAVLDPEKLLWVPGAKTVFIPASVKSLGAVTLYYRILVCRDGRYSMVQFTPFDVAEYTKTLSVIAPAHQRPGMSIYV